MCRARSAGRVEGRRSMNDMGEAKAKSDAGHGGHHPRPAAAAASLSVPAGRSHLRHGRRRELRRRQERDHQRAVLPGPLPAVSGDAGRAHHRGAGADGRRAVRAQSRRGLQGRARLLHGDRQRQVPQAGAAGRPAALSRPEDPQSRPGLAVLRRGEGRRPGRAEAEISAMLADTAEARAFAAGKNG